MAYVSMTIHQCKDIAAAFHSNNGTHWVDILFDSQEIAVFFTNPVQAHRLARAINASQEPEPNGIPF